MYYFETLDAALKLYNSFGVMFTNIVYILYITTYIISMEDRMNKKRLIVSIPYGKDLLIDCKSLSMIKACIRLHSRLYPGSSYKLENI